jgi:chromosome segregation ATPase
MNQLDRVTPSDIAAVALDLVAETAAAIRQSEEQAAHALVREHEIANEIKKELERAELRAESAETMLRLAETQVEQMLAAAAEAAKEIESLRSELAAKVTAIQTIVDAIRTQLPTTLSVPTEEAADVSSTAKRSPFLRIHSGRT